MLPEQVMGTAAPLTVPLQAGVAMPATARLIALGKRRPDRLSKENHVRRFLRCSMAFGLLTFAAQADTAPLLSKVRQLMCSQVASDSQKPGIPGEFDKNTLMAWEQGYLTAPNVMQSRKQTPVTNQHPPGFGADEQWTEMVVWCEGHPDKMYVEAVDFLVGQLDDLSR